ncbi:MAG: RluA family pseudouridine synthase [Bacteroidia bacterium]|nr:RluA family pseudouridine synthase [Bacteroidia bacterium]
MNLKDMLIYEDDVLLVCNKPSGLMVEPDRNNHPNLLQQVKDYLKKQTGNNNPYAQHLHRLDRVTSGIVLFTKQKEHLRNLSEQFAQRQVSKHYIAVTSRASVTSSDTEVLEVPESGILEHWHRKEKKKAALVPEGTTFAEKAKLEYTVKAHGNYFLWNIQLHTGKYHQIRAQLASVGSPIIGDELYGSSVPYQPNAIALHATKLIIKHPVSGKEMIFEVSNGDFESLSHR